MSPLVKKVAKFIKENTKRPRTLPKTPDSWDLDDSAPNLTDREGYGPGLRWKPKRSNDTGVCPLGLLPGCGADAPSHIDLFEVKPPFGQKSLRAFIDWWDAQQNATTAVNSIWGIPKR